MRKSDGQAFGPVSKDELDEWVAQGLIEADNLVYCDGWSEWRSAGDVSANPYQAPAMHAQPSYEQRIAHDVRLRPQSDPPGVIALILGVLAVILVLMSCFIWPLVIVGTIFAVVGLLVSFMAGGNWKVAGLLLNLLALIPALLLLTCLGSLFGIGASQSF